MTKHHYTKTEIGTVTAAVNAGVCLEDGTSGNNILSLAGEAVKRVIDIKTNLLHTAINLMEGQMLLYCMLWGFTENKPIDIYITKFAL